MTSLTVRAGLLSSNIHGYTEEDERAKHLFHLDAREFLVSLARALELPEGSYEIRSNQGGQAVSGEVTLHHDNLFVELSESAVRRGVVISYRSCESQQDFTSGSHFGAHVVAMRQSDRASRFIDECRRLMIEGCERARARNAA